MKQQDLIDFEMRPPRVGINRFPLEKILMEDEDNNNVAICIYRAPNMKPQLVLRLPTGDMVTLGGAQDLSDLETLERCINGFLSAE
jgi:hypothetical protein